jgi:phosphoglycolate phosphatase
MLASLPHFCHAFSMESVPAKPPLLLFDFDGVLADSFAAFYEAFTSVCTEMGFRRLNSKDALLRLFDGNVVRQLWKAGFPFWRIKSLARRFAPRIAATNEKILPFPGMPELLNELAAVHPTYIVSSNASSTAEEFCRRFAIVGIRDVIGSDKETSKVKKIRSICKRHPDRVHYYIGDTKGDMLEGRKAGVNTVAVAWGWHPLPRLLEAKPDLVAQTPEDLRRLFP